MDDTEKYVSEQELNEKAVAPRVTLAGLEENIVGEFYFTAHQGARASFLDKAVETGEPGQKEIIEGLQGLPMPLRLLTFCVVVLKNGFTVTGQSACASPENYDESIGHRVARGDAIRQIWSLMGYELRSRLNNLAELRTGDDRLGEALTRMTAYGLGNKELLRSSDVDAVLTHFLHDEGEEGGRTFAREAISDGVERIMVPVAEPLTSESETEAPAGTIEGD